MSAYEDLMRSLLVERYARVPAPTEPTAGDRLAELTAALRDERPLRRRGLRRQPPSSNIINTQRRTS